MKKLFLISFIFLASTALSLAQVKVLPNGNVGVGTTSPTGKLAITQTITAGGALKGIIYTGALNTNQTLSTEIPSLTLTTTGRQWATGALTLQREVLITQPTYSFVGASTITNAATVGITGAPVKSTNATITNTHALLIQSVNVSFATNSYGLTVNAQSGATNNYTAAFLGGNVGVGTTAPVTNIDAWSSGQTKIRAYSSGSYETSLVAQNGSTTGYSFGVEATPFYGFIGTSAGGKLMKFNSSGNFSVGNANPDAGNKFKILNISNICSFLCQRTDTTQWGYNLISKVSGYYTKAFVVDYNGDKIYMYGNGDIYARNYIQTSDLTLKENVLNITSPLTKVLNLRGVTYNFKPETLLNPSDTLTVLSTTTPKTEIGVIAQEVEQIVPEAVWTNENGIKGVNYGSLVGLLIEAVKEQNQEIQVLKARLDACCKAATPAIGN